MKIPLTVPPHSRHEYGRNFDLATHGRDKLFLFAGDQRVEHLMDDFIGRDIAPEDISPLHYFNIASAAKIGAFTTQLGYIARFGQDYPLIPYVVKLNSKTNLTPSYIDPLSTSWYSVRDIVQFKQQTGLNILGVGYTIYIGSEHENKMFHEAAQIIREAHEYGLLTVIWAYPRGKAITNKYDAKTIAGAATLACALGADIIKVNCPVFNNLQDNPGLGRVVQSAPGSLLICAGGKREDDATLMTNIYDQLEVAKTAGVAIGRNIHQKKLDDAIAFCNNIYDMVYK